MSFTFSALLFAFVLFLGMLLLLEVGRRIALRQKMKEGDGASDGFGALGGSVFALLGLLIAFTFSGAASRFDVRRHLVVEETNAIGTAYLRLDLLPAQAQARLKEDFRQYLDARLEAYRRLPDIAAAREGLARATTLQGEIWRQAVAALQEANNTPATTLLLSALNEMIDITTTRTMAAEMHPPMIIFVMLGAMILASSLLAGYGMASIKSGSWIPKLVFAASLAVAVYVIIDLEYPRLGLIRVEGFDQALVELRQSMK